MTHQRNSRRFVFLAAFLLIAALGASAQSQWDINLTIPYYAGVQSNSGNLGTFTDYLFLMPNVKWSYYFGTETLHFGPGLQLWTLIFESALYPTLSLESNLGDFVLNASFGGGAFLFFGLVNDGAFESVFLPELSVAYRLGKRKIFSVGTGVMFLIAPGTADLDEFAFIGSAFARWTF
ncbi:MAG: hypothetical protein P1P77_11665 [Spirochaetaceae bacterium]|nr:hypothetical protein [Spirochaetaceae bacterium]